MSERSERTECGRAHCGWDAESGVCWSDSYGFGCGPELVCFDEATELTPEAIDAAMSSTPLRRSLSPNE